MEESRVIETHCLMTVHRVQAGLGTSPGTLQMADDDGTDPLRFHAQQFSRLLVLHELRHPNTPI